MKNRTAGLVAVLLSCAGATAHAVEPEDLGACARVVEDAARLACYDRLASRAAPSAPASPAGSALVAASVRLPEEPRGEPPSASFDDPVHDAAPATSPLQARWELTADTDRGTFGLRPHRQNYVVYKSTNRVNDHPFRPLLDMAPGEDQRLDSNELGFQLSFKTKLLGNLGGTGSNLWFGYTQQSNWQVFNGAISRPFRETNYEPEVVWVAPLSHKIGGLQLRYAGLGYVHQSNGRSDPLSRSWDRMFVEVGAEVGDLALWFRPWWRLPESRSRDDNPDIEDYIGRGELVGVYRHGQHQYSVKLRSTFKNSRGSVEADWSFPVAGQLRGYVRLFSGYGESLIDYNWRQTSLGIGLILTDRL
ncbi:phospholipase A [Pseudothauera nasutitermitis]|nr:phospholipase A [Pseudothauera nasutitermitis]